MCGSATLAILVSSTSMNAARETTTPMSHGLTSGVPLALSTEIAVALLIVISFPASLRHWRHIRRGLVNPVADPGHFRITCGVFEDSKGGSFLSKQPLECVPLLSGNSASATALALRTEVGRYADKTAVPSRRSGRFPLRGRGFIWCERRDLQFHGAE